jgi:steroid delta-isomerase-like uncharacterized protein
MHKHLPIALATMLLAITPLAACQPERQQGDIVDLQDFATRYAAAWSNQDPEAFAAFYAEDGVLRVNDGDPAVGRAAITAMAQSFMTAFPDMVVRLDELRTTADHVEFHWHWTGTNTGPGGTGNAVDLRGYEIWTLDDNGLILASLGYYDEADYSRQVNARTVDAAERDAILAVMDKAFAAVRSGLPEDWRAIELTEGTTLSFRPLIGGEPGELEMRISSNEEFIANEKPDGHEYIERWTEEPTVLIRGPIAVVWGEYEFWIDGEFSHCGVDSADLVKIDGEWKIANFMWTVEKENCPTAATG